jgi:hypothetical protein
MRSVRLRTAVLCSAAIAATWFCSDAASALDVGPVSVPVSVPTGTVTVPPTVAVGPVTVPVPDVAPGLGASATVSPQTGVSATVSLPSAIGPVPVPGVQVDVGPGGTGVTPTPGPTSQPAEVGGAGPSDRSARHAGAWSTSATAASRAVAAPASRLGSLRGERVEGTGSASLPPAAVALQPGAVDASLQHQTPGGLWSLLRDLASAHGLWIALLLIVAIARFAAGGLLRDSFPLRTKRLTT